MQLHTAVVIILAAAMGGTNGMNDTKASLSKPVVTIGDKTHSDIAVKAGENQTIKCEVVANPLATISWNTEIGQKLTTNSSSELKIENVKLEHRGEYVCVAKNSLGTSRATVFLRVKNPNDFLVPLIIIAVELVILGVIFAAYEIAVRKRRQQREAEKTD